MTDHVQPEDERSGGGSGAAAAPPIAWHGSVRWCGQKQQQNERRGEAGQVECHCAMAISISSYRYLALLHIARSDDDGAFLRSVPQVPPPMQWFDLTSLS